MPNENDVRKVHTDYAVGFDITDSFSQISIGPVYADAVDTIPTNPGGSGFLVPTALFKRSEVNQWYAGREAVKNRDEEGCFVDQLITKARSFDDVEVGTEKFRPSALLALYLKRTLSLVNTVTPLTNLHSLMITVDVLDNTLIQNLSEAVASLNLKTSNIFFQGHMESFYHYMLYQPKELWMRDVLLIDGTGEYVRSFRLECNPNTTPVVAFIDAKERTTIPMSHIEDLQYRAPFMEFLESLCDGHMISSVFLIGDVFKGEWCKEAMQFLCKKGRVFQGNNLFSKGAVCGAKSRISPTAISQGHVFLGSDKLKSNVGMNVTKRGENVYLPLLDGGVNWYESQRECEVYINQGNKVSFVITPLTGKNPEVTDITLNDLPKRPPKTTRLHIKVKMTSPTRMEVTIKDLGFGELFPASLLEWTEVIGV